MAKVKEEVVAKRLWEYKMDYVELREKMLEGEALSDEDYRIMLEACEGGEAKIKSMYYVHKDLTKEQAKIQAEIDFNLAENARLKKKIDTIENNKDRLIFSVDEFILMQGFRPGKKYEKTDRSAKSYLKKLGVSIGYRESNIPIYHTDRVIPPEFWTVPELPAPRLMKTELKAYVKAHPELELDCVTYNTSYKLSFKHG